jgi:N-acetyl-anhydromuramyl-L-alanine amidase AmpD
MTIWTDLISKYRNYPDASASLKIASLAQWIQESGHGSSPLAQQHLNFAGLKYRERMSGYTQPVDYKGTDGEETTYCKFSSLDAFIKGYWHFIESGPYDDWKKYKSDASGYIDYISPKYAGDKNYAKAVKSLLSEASGLLGIAPSEGPGHAESGRGITVSKPSWTDLPAKFLNKRTTPVLGIVLHDTAGSGKHNDTKYLSNPQDGRKVSVDFTVERDGSIWKLNPDLRAYYCNHAGRATLWHGFKNARVNSVTIGIEIVQKSNLSLSPLYPEAQVNAVADLCAWLSATYSIDNSNITTHRQIITDGSRSDPRKFPFEDFWVRYWEALGHGASFVASLEGNEIEHDEVASADEDADIVQQA